MGLRKGPTVGAHDTGGSPRLVTARGFTPLRARRQPDFVTPMLATAVLAALNEIARGRGERIVGTAERRDPAVAVVVDADVEPHFRHPLGVSHGAGPRA